LRLGINQATGSCRSSRKCDTSGSTTGSTAEMSTMRQGPTALSSAGAR
jgi:hypothetical protein